ncbi:hypothetical protein [Deinococcus sp.]|uniref:hypothetical protein n=1 Tax=Deinococcus sp. TaxID=47478 RepID=UPI0025CE4464|nr:hypothetical protein [Deinococcus sp.]
MPTPDFGKAIACRNATTHGMFARDIVLHRQIDTAIKPLARDLEIRGSEVPTVEATFRA